MSIQLDVLLQIFGMGSPSQYANNPSQEVQGSRAASLQRGMEPFPPAATLHRRLHSGFKTNLQASREAQALSHCVPILLRRHSPSARVRTLEASLSLAARPRSSLLLTLFTRLVVRCSHSSPPRLARPHDCHQCSCSAQELHFRTPSQPPAIFHRPQRWQPLSRSSSTINISADVSRGLGTSQ